MSTVKYIESKFNAPGWDKAYELRMISQYKKISKRSVYSNMIDRRIRLCSRVQI